MPTRSWAWRGWQFSATIPMPRRSGRRAEPGQTGGLTLIEPPPQPQTTSRDPLRALDFLGIAADRGGQHAVESGFGGDDDLSNRIRSVSWYHTIELPGGVVTPGQFDHRKLVPRYGLPARLDGKKALDVATFDGFWAFEMERRGAQVTAIDLDSTRDLDFPTAVRPVVDDIQAMPPIGTGFRIAHEALGSSVQRITKSVYELSPDEIGTFDFVHCGDLLLHLRDPLTALERIRSVTSGQFLLCDVIDLDATRRGAGPIVNYWGGWADVVWWGPSLDALAQMIIDAGFRSVRVNALYQLAKTYDESGPWRASLTADT